MNKKELSKYYYLTLEIKDIENKLHEIRNQSSGVARMTGMPFSSQVGNPTEKQILLIEKYTEKLEKKKLQAMEEIIKIESYISEIKDVETRLIFNKRYIELKKWDVIAREMCMCERGVFKRHSDHLKGLKNV